jgi:hypothetical protein
VKVGETVLCGFKKITALEVVVGNVNVGSFPTISVRYMGTWLRSSTCQRVLIIVWDLV